MTSETVAEYARPVASWKRYGFDKPVVSDSVLQGLPILHLAGGEVPGTPIRSDVTTVYSGSMNYTVECLSSASTIVQILGACTHIIESLRVPSSSTAGWHVLSGDNGVHVSVGRMKQSTVRVTEIADLLGVTHQRASKIVEMEGFPRPVGREGPSRPWDRRGVAAWAKVWRREKPWR